MQIYSSLDDLAGLVPPPALEAEKPAQIPRVYDCIGCRYVDSHGLVCGACLRKILNGQAEKNKSSLIAACFDEHGMTLLRGRCAALVQQTLLPRAR